MSKKAKEVINNLRKFIKAYEYGRGKKPERVSLYRKDFEALSRYKAKQWKQSYGDLPPPTLTRFEGIKINVVDK